LNETLYSSRNARRSVIDTLAFRALSQISTIVGYVILVRAMSEQDFGVLSLLYAFIPVVATAASLGLEQVLRRFQPEYLRAGDRAGAAWLVRVVTRWRFGTSVIVLAAIIALWQWLAPTFKLTEHRDAFLLFCVLITLHFQVGILQIALSSHMLHRFSVGATALLSFVKLIAYLGMYQYGRLTLEAAIIADTAAYACAYGVLLWAYRRRCLGPETNSGFALRGDERRRLLRYGVLNNFNDAGVLLMYSTLDTFFIAAFIDTLSVGIYAFYTRLRGMFASASPLKLFETVIQPMIFAVPREEADRKLPQYFSFLLNIELLVQWPALAIAIVYHAELVQLVFAGKFAEHSWLLPVIFGFGIANSMADPVALVAQYEERAGIILTSKIFTIYNLAAMALLVPALGIVGAVLASGTAQLLKNVFIWWHVRRRAVWINAWKSLATCASLWGATVVACAALKGKMAATVPLQLALGAVVIFIALCLHARSSALTNSDRTILASLAGERRHGVLRRFGLLPSGATGT
jgi:O-antigen/teichoic acid export membrane protein